MDNVIPGEWQPFTAKVVGNHTLTLCILRFNVKRCNPLKLPWFTEATAMHSAIPIPTQSLSNFHQRSKLTTCVQLTRLFYHQGRSVIGHGVAALGSGKHQLEWQGANQIGQQLHTG
jgi:hypothetical protein